jgi:DNA-binding FadR family transcriptional regulator
VYSRVDMEFHLGMANCSHNEFLPYLLTTICGVLIEWIAKSQQLRSLLENAHEQHNRITNRSP